MNARTSSPPVVLELADLPREQIGPFLLLGLDKTANAEDIEASWAKRIIWARKSAIRTALEDINWAREALKEAHHRAGADAASLNLDSTEKWVRRLEERYGGTLEERPAAQPIDVEKDLADYVPPIELPNAAELRASVRLPEVPRELPAVRKLLADFAAEPLDPWQFELPT